MKPMIKRLSYIIPCILLISCSANKFLPEGEKYFEGHEIRYSDSSPYLTRIIKNNLSEDLEPEPTRRFIISRPGTWLYEVFEKPTKPKSLSHWIKYKLGNEPTYLSGVNLERNASIIQSKLSSNGFFRAEVETEIDSAAHKGTVIYSVTLNEAYIFDTLEICTSPDTICTKIDSLHRSNPQIVGGNLFQKSKLAKARSLIAKGFKNDGYFYFVPEFTFFKADSTVGDHSVKLKLRLKDKISEVGLSQYKINSVTVNLAAGSEKTKVIGDSLRIIIDPDKLFIKPRKLAPFIAIEPGQLYNAHDQETTLKQLNRLEVFQFVNIQFMADTSNDNHLLDVKLLARPKPKHSLRSEIHIETTSTSFTGPGIQFEYFNRNVFHGAEQFRFTAVGRYEKQLTSESNNFTAYNLDLSAALLFPRVSIPLFSGAVNAGNVPKTKYEVSYRIYDQPKYYGQSSLGASFGYEWLHSNELFNDLKIVNLEYVKFLHSSNRLEALFDQGILARESFDDLFILGPSYHFTYNPVSATREFLRFSLGGSVEASGNILHGIYNLADAPRNADGQYTFSNVPFAQYTRFQVDFRTYYDLGKFNTLVFRQNIGLGIAYGNSTELPFSKQFAVGGASSLRGFRARSVGPGTYYNPGVSGNSYFDQTGDILVEINLENRVDLGTYLEGAIFLGMGNVWLQRESNARPGGKFEWKDFISEMAVAGGLGIRFDLQFVIIRLDFGVPLRKPYQKENNGWVFNDIKFNNQWLDENLILNIAIGYPF